MRSWIALGSLLLATTASAQTTDCRWIGSVWSCNTPPPESPPLDYGKTIQSGSDAVGSYEDTRALELKNRALRDQINEERNRQMIATKVGKLVSAGQCAEGKKLALTNGYFDLAKLVDEVCED